MRQLRADKTAPVRGAGTRPPNCVADDWGMSPGVNLGILALCEAGMVRCISMLANLEHSGYALDRLLRLDNLEFSLHLNFTHGRPLSRPAEVPSLCRPDGVFNDLSLLLQKAFLGRLPAAELELESGRQVRRLKSMGVPLTGIEGHHHVHLLPRVFTAISGTLRDEGIGWARVPADKGHIQSWLGGKMFRRWLRSGAAPARAREFELRPTLYLRQGDLGAAGRLEKKLRAADGLPVIVHPAHHNDLALMEYSDPYQEGRVLEYQKLMELARRPGRSRRHE